MVGEEGGGRGVISGNATVTATSPPLFLVMTPLSQPLTLLFACPLLQLLEEWKPRFQAARQCYRDRKRKLELLSMAVLPMEPGEEEVKGEVGGAHSWIYRSGPLPPHPWQSRPHFQ